MKNISSAKLLIVFAIAFSLATLPGPLSLNGVLPGFHLAHAGTAGNEPWYPAGPAMDTLVNPIFSDETAEFTALQAKTIDFTDWPLSPDLIAPLTGNAGFLVTSPISDNGYFELQFHEGQTFWGCQFNYGNPATQTAPLTTTCGLDIRQAFAHGLDKSIFITNQLGGNAQPIDNPVPPSVDLNTPNPCAWDPLFIQTGPGCVVNGAGGTAYHLATATAGVGPSVPTFAWTPGLNTADFCAAADHLIHAGLATGKITGTCQLTGIAGTVSSPIHIFVRSDNTPRLNAGNSYGQFICALFTGTFSTGCPQVVVDPGPITAFPGFGTSPTTVQTSWWVYTAGFGNVLTFDSSLYFGYHSKFADGVPVIKSPSGPCSAEALASFAPGNYQYICNSSYDTKITQAEFAPCLTAAGDPTTGQTTPTFANCSGTSQPSAASAAYQAQDVYGQNVYTIPWWSGKNNFAYQVNWQRGVLNKGSGHSPPGSFFTTLNAYSASPGQAGTVRQGFKQSTGSVSPFIGNTIWDAAITGSIWDGVGATNPDSPQAYLDWMTVKTDQLLVSQLSYTAPTGTVAAFRYTLRNDIFWHTGQKVTAWDIAFSDIALRASGSVNGGGLAPMTGVKVLSPTQVDLLVNGVGPFTKLFLSAFALPGRNWSGACTPAAWDAAANNPNFAAANTALTACIAPASAVTASGVVTPAATNVDSAKIQPTFDPSTPANAILVGSGGWVCKNGALTGGDCSSSHNQAPPTGGTWTLQRYGQGTTPGGSLNTYFRSSGNLALWVWSQDRGVFSSDFLNFGVVSLCFGKAVGTSGCTVWQHGIGGTAAGVPVGLTQVSIVQRFVGVNWVAPYDWALSPPQNIGTFPPVLYEGAATLNPCSIDAVNGYNC